MKNPSNSKSQDENNTAGFLLIMNRRGDRQIRYIEKCEKMIDRLREIRNTNTLLRDYLDLFGVKRKQYFKDADGNDDLHAWFKYNWVAVRAERQLKYFADNSIPDDVKLCRFWSDLQVNDDTNVNAYVAKKSIYELKRMVKKTQKVKCPHCGKLQTRTNLSRHINHYCKGISTNKG